MKMLKVAGLLLAVCFMNNVQSMQPIDQFPVERSFLSGRMSANDYVSYLASLSPEYARKIDDLRRAQPVDLREQFPYAVLLSGLETMPMMAQRVLAAGLSDRYEGMISSLQNYVIRAINTYHQELERGTAWRHGFSRYGG